MLLKLIKNNRSKTSFSPPFYHVFVPYFWTFFFYYNSYFSRLTRTSCWVFLNCFQLLQISFCCSKNGPFFFYRNPIFINWKKNCRGCLGFLEALKNVFQRAWSSSLWLAPWCHYWPFHKDELGVCIIWAVRFLHFDFLCVLQACLFFLS